MNNVFVYCEIEGTQVQEVSQELLTKGRKLANELKVELHAIVAGTGIKGKVEDQILPYGVDNQVQQAWTLWQQTYADLDTQRKSVELARQNYQVVNDRYLNQLALITDMLDIFAPEKCKRLDEKGIDVSVAGFWYFHCRAVCGWSPGGLYLRFHRWL